MAIYSGGIKIRRNICVLAAFLLVIEAVLVTAAIDLLIPQTHFGSNFFPLFFFFFFSFPSPKPITLVPNLFHFSSVYLPLKKKKNFSLSLSKSLIILKTQQSIFPPPPHILTTMHPHSQNPT